MKTPLSGSRRIRLAAWLTSTLITLTSAHPAFAQQAPSLSAFVGRELVGSRFSMRVNVDGLFELRERDGRARVTGVYSYIPGRLTLLDPRNGDTGLSFPMRCRVVQPSPVELRFENLEGGCSALDGHVFRLQPS